MLCVVAMAATGAWADVKTGNVDIGAYEFGSKKVSSWVTQPDNVIQESYGPFVPGAEVELDLGLVGYAAKKLPSGLKLDKKTGIVKGKAKKPGEYQVTFTKKGAETLTAKFIVGTWAVEIR